MKTFFYTDLSGSRYNYPFNSERAIELFSDEEDYEMDIENEDSIIYFLTNANEGDKLERHNFEILCTGN